MRRALGSILLVLLTACGGAAKSGPEGDPSVVAQPTPEGTAPANAEPGPAAAVEQPMPKKRRPYEIVSLCPNVTTILYGEDPKSPNVGSATVGPNGRIDDGPRDKDGNQIIWLMVRGEPLVKVRVSRGTKRVEIGTSCDTLEMH